MASRHRPATAALASRYPAQAMRTWPGEPEPESHEPVCRWCFVEWPCEHAPADQDRRDGEALRLLADALPEGWLLMPIGPMSADGEWTWHCSAVELDGEAHVDAYGPTLAEAADACRARLPR